MTRLGLLLVGLAVAALPLAAQQPAPSPRFEVVSVKENQAVDRAGIVSGPNQPGKYSFINMPLGTYPEGANPQAQHLQMIQNALADRFHLKAHREPTERTVYKLVLARADRRLGPMLVPSSVDCVQWRRTRSHNWVQVGRVL